MSEAPGAWSPDHSVRCFNASFVSGKHSRHLQRVGCRLSFGNHQADVGWHRPQRIDGDHDDFPDGGMRFEEADVPRLREELDRRSPYRVTAQDLAWALPPYAGLLQ